MIVISSTELRNDTEKYLDTESFVLTQELYLSPDEDFHRAISIEDFRKGAKEHIRKLYSPIGKCEIKNE